MCASAKFWMSVLTDLENRGVGDVFFVVCDSLRGLPDVVGKAWPALLFADQLELLNSQVRASTKRIRELLAAHPDGAAFLSFRRMGRDHRRDHARGCPGQDVRRSAARGMTWHF